MSLTNDRRGVRLRACLFGVLALIVHGVGLAQTATTSPENEYKKLVKVDEEIKPLGETPFGESLNLFDGGFSFHVVDISVPGNGPTIEIGRTFQADGDSDVRLDNESFGDWDIELPRFSTMTSDIGQALSGPPIYGWVVDTDTRVDRCTYYREPPDMYIGPYEPGKDPVKPEAWWNGGYTLRIPGVPEQTMLSRSNATTLMPQMPSLNFVALSRDNWRLACLPNTVNQPEGDQVGEAFLAVGPDGSKYWLNYLVYRKARGYKILRRMGYMFATHMEDRFGNWLNYHYGVNGRIESIDASDGRRVTFAYTSDGKYIAQISVVAGGTSRTWSYGYTPTASGVTLSFAQLPDGSRWTYDLSQLTFNVVSTPRAGDCLDPDPPDESLLKVGLITGPSGLQGRFEARPTRHGRSGVYAGCEMEPVGQPRYWNRPRYTNNLALRSKVFTGAGLPLPQTWTYAYPLATGTFTSDCASTQCDYTSQTVMVDPAGNATKYTFSNHADVTEGKPLRTDYYVGGVSANPIRYDTYLYADPSRGPYPDRVGYSFDINGNQDRLQKEIPLLKQEIHVDGDVYTWQALDYDILARPTSVRRFNSNGYTVEENSTYLDDVTHWVVGLPDQTFNVTRNETVSRNVYTPGTLTLAERYSFGRKVMSYTFNTQGQLASFTDGNNKTTTLGSYKRGIPQAIGYPDGTSQSLVVDDFGQIASITNQAGAKTSYGYDAIGRLARIDYPAGDSVNWAPKTFSYGYIGDARGMGGAHWMRLVTQGSWSERLDYDAMLRPVMYGTAEAGTGALYISSRTEYDWRGHKTFQSYPVNGAGDRQSIVAGVSTTYDALGRPTTSTQNSELGNLTTTTQYSVGSSRSIIDPKGNVTSSWYQAFDQPSYDSVVKVLAPENVLQTIARDVYGNPLSITQSGAGQSVTKTMTYDTWHRLCRTWEPESGSEIMAYDGADNLAWSVSGATYNVPNSCGQDQVADVAKTVRVYDGMNRVTSVLYPAGTAPSTFTYDALGNPATATSGSVSWTFGRNKLGLLTAEVLSVDGWNWALGYGYDNKGALSTVLYPDGDIVAYNPDALKRPTTVGGYASGISYYPDGDAKSYYIGNGGIYSSDKNARNLLSNFTYGKNSVPSVSEDFIYDANGNVGRINDVSGSNQRTKAMSYDGLNRLLSARADSLWGTESYTYDTLNNIRTLTNSSGLNVYNYDGSNRLTSITVGSAPVHTFAYDERGNTIDKDGKALSFDLANRLGSIGNNGENNYTYDAAGRRVKKVTPAGTTYYAYNSAGQLMWEVDPATRLGSEYIYLGKKLIAKATENVDILKQGQVHTALSIVGVPQLSLDGTTIDVTLDIANNGSRPLTANSQYPVQMGYHLIDPAGVSTQVEPGVNLPTDIPVGGHGTITMHVAAPAVLGTGKMIRFSLLQVGVVWFTSWPGNTTVDAGPYSACPKAGTGNLCNNVTGLTQGQVGVTLTVTGAPTLSDDGQTVLTTVDIANHGTVTLASASPHPVQLGNHLIDGTGASVQTDVTRAAIPEIAPGQHAAVTIATPSSLLLGLGRRVQFELVQEGLHWFRDFGFTPLVAGPYATLGGATGSIDGSFALSWQPIPGATSYNLQERVGSGSWTTVQGTAVTSWSTSGRATGTYAYQVQACAADGCAPYGPTWTVNVLLPPPVPASLSASAPIPGPITISWAASTTATRYVVNQQFNGGAWTTYYNSAGTSTVISPAATGTYVYQVQACNSSGCSGFRQSSAVSITRPPASAPGIAGGGAVHTGAFTISWNAVAGAVSYNLVESVNGGAWVQRQNTAALSWSTSGRGDGTITYQVQGCNTGGCGPWSAQAIVTSTNIPPAPGLPRAEVSGTDSKPVLKLSWDAVPYATTYEVQETNPNGHVSIVGSGPSLTWSSLKTMGQWNYNIRACNAVGCSAWGRTKGVFL